MVPLMEPAAVRQSPLELAGKLRYLPGYTHGMRYPSLLVPLLVRAEGQDVSWLESVDTLLDEALAKGGAAATTDRQSPPVIEALLRVVDRVQRAAGVPVLALGMVTGADAGRATVRIPVLRQQHAATAALLKWTMELFRLLASALDTGEHLALLRGIIHDFRSDSYGANHPRFLRAAHAMGVPFLEFPSAVLQYGQGRYGRWFESSLTDQTSRIGTGFARNKMLTAQMLRQAGVPSSRQLLVRDAADAVRAAEVLGYPVVVKPLDTDGGVAVSTGLRSPAAVEDAFALATGQGSGVLVEKHFDGRDFRLIIVHSDLIWASERVPASVVGDGVTSVRGLIERENAARAAGTGTPGSKVAMVFDEDARLQLELAGLTIDSVPSKEQWVRLRGAANVMRGGFARGVLDRVHPDNRLLGIRAADALRLDIAGVDLLIPDISRSWHEIGALVCEVNAQPDLGVSGPHVYGEILKRLLPANGRIPVVVLLGARDHDAMTAAVARRLATDGRVVGRTGPEGVWIGSNRIIATPSSTYAGAIALMTDTGVEAAVVSVSDMSILRDGLPFDRIDVLVVAGTHLSGQGGVAASRADFAALLKALVPMCDGTVLTVAESGLNLAPSLPTPGGEVANATVAETGLAEAVGDFLQSARFGP